MRVLRYLRRCDWVTAPDIHLAIGVHSDDVAAYNQAVCRLAKSGAIERRGASQRDFIYRITDAGRREYEQLMARAQRLPPMSDREVSLDERDTKGTP